MLEDLTNKSSLLSRNSFESYQNRSGEKDGRDAWHLHSFSWKVRKKCSIKSNKPEIYAEVDDTKFFQVINNLISHSIRFTHENGNIIIWIEELDDSILIIVKDDGIGIPEDLQPYIYDKFTPACRPGLKEEPPIDMGMYIIKRLIELHGEQ